MRTSRLRLLPFVDELLYNKLPYDIVWYISSFTAKFIYYNKVVPVYTLRVKHNRKDKYYTRHMINSNYKLK